MQSTADSHQRLYSVDFLRGAVMMIMALDHVRDYFHYPAWTDSPTNLLTTTPILFFTRWITHFCAPTFLLLSGISAYLMGQKKSKKELSLFLVKRGIWLVLVEVVLVSLAWTYDPLYHLLILQVIWATGISMIILGILVWLPDYIVLVIGLLIICFHNMLDYAEADRKGHVGILWDIIHHGNFTPITLGAHRIALIVYAFLPWAGIMLTGYGLGKIFTSRFPARRRRIILYLTGSVFLLLFIVLRSINQYGDTSHWSHIRSQIYTLLSFINVTKYPPSLDFISLTIGSALILLGLFDRISKNTFSFVRVFGRVPFFYYVIHIYLIHALTVIFFFAEGFRAQDIKPVHSPFLFRPDQFGYGLPIVYLIWIAVLMILYPICRKYDQYKSTHKKWWLSYL